MVLFKEKNQILQNQPAESFLFGMHVTRETRKAPSPKMMNY